MFILILHSILIKWGNQSWNTEVWKAPLRYSRYSKIFRDTMMILLDIFYIFDFLQYHPIEFQVYYLHNVITSSAQEKNISTWQCLLITLYIIWRTLKRYSPRTTEKLRPFYPIKRGNDKYLYQNYPIKRENSKYLYQKIPSILYNRRYAKPLQPT